jgi:hypothetical protein
MKEQKSSKKKRGKTAREELVEELTRMIKGIDEEGLIFLIEQANVLLYNMRVKKINKKIAEAAGQKREKGVLSTDERKLVDIEESQDGNFFYIIVNQNRIFFTLDEMKSLVRICHASSDETDASQRLYNWLSRNRKDFLIDGEIGSSRSRALSQLYSRIVRTYKVKQK